MLKDESGNVGGSGGGDREESPKVQQVITDGIQVSWICPICFFSNNLDRSYQHGSSELPVCLTCGIKASKELIGGAIEDHSRPPSPPAATATTPVVGTGTAVPVSTEMIDRSGSSTPSGGELTAVNDDNERPLEGFKCPRCTFINHPSLNQCEMCGARLISPRLPPGLIRTDSPGPTTLIDVGGGKSSNSINVNIIKLSFRGNGDKAFYNALKKVIMSKEWVSISSSSLNTNNSNASTTQSVVTTSTEASAPVHQTIGIHGLQQAGERNRQKRQEILGSALDDLQGLMSRAQDLIKIAEQYAHHLEKEEMKSSTPSTSLQARKALRQSSQALGLNSTVVTKEMAHDPEVFHSELARQLAEFLDTGGILTQEGGVISLFDLFAIYNRARGFSLISPKDLYSACELCERLQLPIRLRKFKSGLLVVQQAYRTPAVTIRHISEWIATNKNPHGISAQDASTKFGWSLTVANEELEMAEEHGALCRDEQISGTRFFPNLFLHPLP